MPTPASHVMTFDDWYRLPDDGRLYEIIEGELFVTPPPVILHQRVSRNIEVLVFQFLERTGLGEMLHAPVGVRLDQTNVVEPDIVVILKDRARLIGREVIDGAPNLVVEVLSPGTTRKDLGRKRDLYARYGVEEYWIVDPMAQKIDVLMLEGRRFERAGLYTIGDLLRSPLLTGLELDLKQVFVPREAT